ncbi:MAG: hypothetical protein OXU20_19425 [Myxococcales bacterium]|nr:hypothetical protein [Myxococcales bacterium]
MPLFRVTKKLSTALKVKLPKQPVEQHNPEHEWFADLFFVQGKKAVIWVHRPTLLTFVRPAVTAAELREFHGLFRFEFRTILASLALPETLIDRFGVYEPEAYAPTDERRVVGSMLDYRHMFDHMVLYTGGLGAADIAEINMKLNQSPMSVLETDSADRVLRRMVTAS